ncbi:GcrA family cell cycle regulator [Paracoccus sp. p3-h83]|uniref:GcrA family cell cycle regulator n=1 Tax=Paracoccus sp. p3-h83 TaxID=3342805 RepID=UPI0035B8932A
MSWTDERVELLKKMWAEGQSASQIAKELGSVTRNAVIGKVHRLGLSNRTTGAEPEAEPVAEKPVEKSVEKAAEAPVKAAEPASDKADRGRPADKPAEKAADKPARPRAEKPVTEPAADQDEADEAPPPSGSAAAMEAGLAASTGPMPAALRRAQLAAGQPLPPQPSANEISPEALASVREVERKARKLKLMELTERTCKWPIGDPATEQFWFCGLPCQPGKPYCEAHVGVAFQPMSARRDRRR